MWSAWEPRRAGAAARSRVGLREGQASPPPAGPFPGPAELFAPPGCVRVRLLVFANASAASRCGPAERGGGRGAAHKFQVSAPSTRAPS